MAGKRILLGIKDKPLTKEVNDDSLAAIKQKVSTPKKGTKRKDRDQPRSPEDEARLARKRAAYQAKKIARQEQEAEDRTKQSLIVAIDLGCTFTGVAFIATNHDGNQVQVMNEWPKGDRVEKVPTRIAYKHENASLRGDVYGYEVRPGLKSYAWFKLHLDKKTRPTDFDDPRLRQSAGLGIGNLPPGKLVVDVNYEYLTFIYNQALFFLRGRMGEHMVKETPIKFYLTTPSLWSLEARALTREAATRAGFGTRINTLDVKDELHMIDEPEAAAIASIQTTINQMPHANPFKEDQGIIVADLGGGTADLVSYKIVSLKPLQLEEICIGIGGKTGGTSIDRALHILMEQRYSTAFSSLPHTKIGPGSTFMEAFEKNKRIFTSDDESRNWELPLKMPKLAKKDPAPAHYDLEEDNVLLTCADMEGLFDEAIIRILALVTEQVDLITKNRAPAAKIIILCGGLGSSPYVARRFQEFCKTDLRGKVEVIQPLQPWSVVCRGAALRGLEDCPILSRRSRAHYGFVAHMEFEASKHDEADAYHDQVLGKRAMNQMSWPVKKNEKLKPGTSKTRPCQYIVPPKVTRLRCQETLYQCDDDKAPSRLGESVLPAGVITIELTRYLELQRYLAEAKGTLKVKEDPISIEVVLVFAMGGDKGVLEVSARSGNREVGATTVEWEPNSVWQRDSEVKIEEDGLFVS